MNSDIFFSSDSQFERLVNSLVGRNISAEGPEFELEEFVTDTLEDDIYSDLYDDVPSVYVFEA